jgi:hypothetical protein
MHNTIPPFYHGQAQQMPPTSTTNSMQTEMNQLAAHHI